MSPSHDLNPPSSGDGNPEPAEPEPDRAGRRAETAESLATALTATPHPSTSITELKQRTLTLINQVFDALYTDPFTTAASAEIGGMLVDKGFTGQESLRVTMEILGAALLREAEEHAAGDTAAALTKIVTLLSAIATEYTAAMRQSAGEEQKRVKLALRDAKQEAERRDRAARSWFDEVFNASSIGIALTDMGGKYRRTNPAFASILEHERDQLRGRSFHDHFPEADAHEVQVAFRDVADGIIPRIKQRRRMLRADGTTALVHCVISVLRDVEGVPSQQLLMIEDLSDQQELQNQLGHQSVHDMLTGLSNRQHFESKVDAARETATADTSVTLIYLGLDAFSVINASLGHRTGDRVLQVVANKLKSVVNGCGAAIGRVGGDEFGILLRNTKDTPDFQELIEAINVELSEPVYIDDRGLAVCASIGVFQHVGRFPANADPLRAASATMRRAKAAGKRQWELYDPRIDADQSSLFTTAAGLPGAWENGELDIEYRPVLRLSDNKIIAVEGSLRWEHATLGVIGNDQCREMAELTGMSLDIGPWICKRTCEDIRDLLPSLDLDVDGPAILRGYLTRSQSADGDLTGRVKRILAETGLPADQIELNLDVRSVLAENMVALDNLETLPRIGVVTGLHGFTGSYQEFALIEDQRVRSVILADEHARSRKPERAADSVLTRVSTNMVRALHDCGATVTVTGLPTEEDAAWWREIGADFASGPFTGQPGPLDEVLG